ncbi:MAG: helix-turn-helix domain-containing protein [Clostridia bacterium]|nr:helix-turn-helix domain-containing protein [Clostridia bacterium]
MDTANTFTQFQLEPERDKPEFFHITKYKSDGYYAHFHRNSELYCVFDGTVKVSVNDKTYLLRSGEAAFINSLDLHSYQCEQPATVGIALLGYRYMRDFRAVYPNHVLPTLLKNKKANEDMFSLLTQLTEKETFSEFEKFSYTNLFLHYITDNYGVSAKETSHKFLLIDVIQYIYDNYMSPLSLEIIAKEFNYNPIYLSHLFAKYIKIDFRTFVSNVRMQHVFAMQNDIRYKGKSLIEISEICGFNSLSTFKRAYKRAILQDQNAAEHLPAKEKKQ